MAAPSRPDPPSPFERRRRRTRTLALVLAIALVATLAVPFAALAAPGPTAEAGPVAALAAPAASRDAADARDVLGTAQVHEVWLWTTAFLRGDAAAVDDPVESAEQWVAPGGDGTRTAWRDPEQDEVVLAASDDDVALAGALADLTAADRLVTDEGDWLVVGDDGTVRALLPDRPGQGPVERVALAAFQTERAARWEAVLAQAGQDGTLGGGAAGAPSATQEGPGALRSAVPWAVGGALLMTVTALAVRARRAGR